ncbi:MAG TPA: DUF3300 domain-containing protein [Candidatus Sulfotelmatobacter sp.]|nr:DUF3300 domain-containing protein [Candidatus Sulfotelmatobacter sp.]
MAILARSLRSQLTAAFCSMLLVPGGPVTVAQAQEQQQAAVADEPAPKIPNDQLDSLVAPIALYPDPLLAQVLAASTYPLEIVQLQQWLTKNKGLKDKALADAVQKQPWDPSIQSMAALPDVVKRLADDIGWTTDLGNAVLAQQADVMDAVQRMRAKAKDKGNLKSTEQMQVETKTVESKEVIVIQQSKPEVVYVPSYDPVVVYGAPPYPYPPIAYPPPGYYAGGLALSFGVGMMVGAAMGGGWCCNSGWGGGGNNNININNNNTFVNNSNRQNINNSGNRTGNRTGSGNSWQHNAQHRGGTPYANKATANKFGGTARGDSMGNRQANARQNQGQRGGGQQAGSMDRGGRQQAGSMDRGGGASGANRAGGGGGDKVGNRSVSSGSGAGSKGGGFGGASSGSGQSARASSSRGASSMGGSRGGSRSGGGGRRR